MQRVGNYELIHRIASGGMAEVWMGRRHAMGGASKAVAIKLLAPHLASKAIYRRMFVDEARLTMMLTHSNIVSVFDVGEQGGRSFLVMEWIDGLDLSRLAQAMRERDEALPIHVIAHVIGEVLRGLAYAHGLTEGESSSTIVHRDISPHNVLISVSGEVKVSDFGVARLASEETSGLHVRGKLRYMPPEQVRGQSKHPGIDLFAVGAMLQELLDGVRFRAGLERDELFGMVIAGEVPPLQRRGVPPAIVALRDGLLASRTEDRLASAERALELLRRWPGYRNATAELAELVRSCAGVSAPRTGLTVEVSDDQLELNDEPTVHEGAARDRSSALATRTVKHADALGSETTPHPELRSSQARPWGRRGRRRAAAAGLVLSVGISLGFGYSWLAGSEVGPDARAAVESDEVAKGPSPTAHERSEPPPVLASATTNTRESINRAVAAAAAPAPVDDAVSVAKTKAKPAVDKPPVEVEFAAHQFFFVWVKVDGKKRALEPVAKMKLRPGNHQVWLRERDDQPWRKAGRIKLSPGGSYRVTLEKPAKAKLKKI